MRARIDIAVADPALQRDAPLPTRLERGRAGIRRHRSAAFARHRHRAIARQDIAPVDIGRAQRLSDQQGAEAGAIDEQVALDPAAVVQFQRGDIAALAVQFDVFDRRIDMAHALRLRARR